MTTRSMKLLQGREGGYAAQKAGLHDVPVIVTDADDLRVS